MNRSDAAVTQVMIPVDNFERGVAFYRDVLGTPFSAPPMMSFFRTGAVRLLVGVRPAGRTRKVELWLAEFADPDGNQLAPMSEVAASGA